MTQPPTDPGGRSLRVTVRTTAKRDKGPDENQTIHKLWITRRNQAR